MFRELGQNISAKHAFKSAVKANDRKILEAIKAGPMEEAGKRLVSAGIAPEAVDNVLARAREKWGEKLISAGTHGKPVVEAEKGLGKKILSWAGKNKALAGLGLGAGALLGWNALRRRPQEERKITISM
jgi:hypothetical protein